MIPEAVQHLEAADEVADEPAQELREHLDFQRAQARRLRVRCGELAHELALTRRLLANLLPLADGEGTSEVTAAVRLPADAAVDAAGELRFSLDALDRGPARTHFRGWAFAPELADCARAATTLWFVPVGEGGGPALPHAAATRPQPRPDVAAAFAGLTPAPARLEGAGFEATVLDLSVAPGEYELVLQVTEPGEGAVSRTTGVRLRF